MRIVEPYAKMLSSIGPNPTYDFTHEEGIMLLKRIEYFARVSHASEYAITSESWDRFLHSVVLQHGDWSVTEHEKVTVEFLVDRGITHEIVRHRIGSYTQESTQFINYQKKGGEAKFIAPLDIVPPPSPWRPAPPDYDKIFAENKRVRVWEALVMDAEQAYMALLDCGAKPQVARSVLPNALASKIIVTYNLRSWRHFFIMRTSAQAHPQMRQVCDPLLAEFQAKIPILYEDIEAGRQQSEAIRVAR